MRAKIENMISPDYVLCYIPRAMAILRSYFILIYPSQRQNLLPTLEILIQNFENFQIFKILEKKFPNSEFFSKISKTTKGPPLTSKGPPPPCSTITKFSFFIKFLSRCLVAVTLCLLRVTFSLWRELYGHLCSMLSRVLDWWHVGRPLQASEVGPAHSKSDLILFKCIFIILAHSQLGPIFAI